MIARNLLILMFSFTVVGCYSLKIDSGQLRCSVNEQKCPDSFHCATDGYCWKNGQDPQAASTTTGHKGIATVSGAVSAQSPHYKIIMSTGQGPGGSQNSASSKNKLRTGVIGATGN